MKRIINKLTTKAEITNYLSLLNTSYEVGFDEIHRKLQQTCNHKPFLEQVQSICLSDHAVERWNERVGPCVTEASLIGTLNSLLLVPGSMTLVSKEEGRIEGDIVFTYFIEEGTMVITTFYGRVSLRPALNNLQLLKRFNHCEHDTYNLMVSKDILNKQRLPFIPEEIIQYNGSNHCYLIQKYVNRENESCLFLYKIVSGNITNITKIDPNYPELTPLSRKTLYILYRLGYGDFVIEHLMLHKPAMVNEIKRQSLLEEIFRSMNIDLSLPSLPFSLIPYAPIIRGRESVEFVGLVQAS